MKKLLSVLLALVMALGLLATTAWAYEHNHCVCGTTGTIKTAIRRDGRCLPTGHGLCGQEAVKI